MTLIPSSTIQHNGEVSFVYVIQNGAAHVHNVKPGTTDGGITAVEGVNPGDVIATSSFERLQDGAKTIIAKKPASPGTSESNAP
jgi:multidrug efflux system membrane fusion protein